ncbi:TetR/AcrR family transcriptional regulator [Prauserella cavernicola]|uniref:TetR/AcrR family transcriptional regulator n=1 Tax=Prauserella cavernicola TaxID=2800127 RepID=A0A934QP65_9PSEU|nr:TetR/AcrR family transcriptional regulator [Prauserella cavernicola]MBK1783184.1 TetR/AcrR family transcriptional regulator [Prauserella cavernicola]
MSQQRSDTAETGTRARTRRAILDAAVTVLSQDISASLGDIAATAGVGRTTMHRYFPERSDLLAAISLDALEQADAAATRARLDDGPGADAVNRLCQELFEVGDPLMLLFNNPQLMTGKEWEEESDFDREVMRVVERGRSDGSLDPDLDAAWALQVVWALLYSAWMHSLESGVPKLTALSLCLRTVDKAFRP